ncbi:monoterpene epsilon-lactone hydrolase [Microbacteriaceae bacterium SG_E_30_P1]|uniref:Monoterpene epsilon-lactone hydrolase n=1 Tax=Antiquaquibacter oligotrophicus TaxID=2880260 RepID=A0ABT6KJ77_9MICO|nr:alpha/beta hydrolase [Antiquaquibacter oligotrophicus]MDH6180037.1 monoterpene epsilon-lactone hydrolase [Antiquaquibacter oligotrophicus]UDF14209.1 alpha/beta hydrolase [Antiquaquibacter oligotrophicus]
MSLSMRATGMLVRLSRKTFTREHTLEASLRKRAGSAPIPRSMRRRMDVAEQVVAGHPVTTVTPTTGATGTQVIYLHGGSYIHGLDPAHWRIVAAIIDGTGATVTVPDYGLAPEHTVDEGYAFLEEVVARTTGRPLFIAGDSAGAALALGLAISKRATTLAGLILFSPWVDATMSNPAIQAVLPSDPMLVPEVLRAAGAAWAGSRDPRDLLISPINDTLAGLPPIAIYQGARDIFLPDAERFAEKARQAGTDVTLRVYADAFHDFVGAGWTPEAKDAFRRVADVITAG